MQNQYSSTFDAETVTKAKETLQSAVMRKDDVAAQTAAAAAIILARNQALELQDISAKLGLVTGASSMSQAPSGGWVAPTRHLATRM